MKSFPFVTRRRFLGAATATAGGVRLAGRTGRGDQPLAPSSAVASTDHFWYRPQPEGIFVDSQRDNRVFCFAEGKVLLSEDNGRTWPHSIAFPDARDIVFSCILQNGNVLFSALAKLYLSTDNLRSYRQITVKNTDGSDYLPHAPQNPAHPGWYFHSLTGVNTWDVKGTEMLVWGNYCNVIGGASTDLGKTWSQYDLKEFGRRSPCRFHRMNSEGWFRVDLRSSWVTPAEMMFIKPKKENAT